MAIKELYLVDKINRMDMFEIPDDYKPEKPLTDEEADDITNYLKGHPLFMKDVPEDGQKNEAFQALQAIEEEG